MSPKKSFFISFILLLFATFLMALIDAEIKTPLAHWGIVSFEFCGFTQNCDAMLNSWTFVQQKWVMLSLGADFLYMPVYAWCFIAAGRLLQATKALVGLSLLAVMCDVGENIALINVLQGNQVEFYPMLACILASIKFAALGLGLILLLLRRIQIKTVA